MSAINYKVVIAPDQLQLVSVTTTHPKRVVYKTRLNWLPFFSSLPRMDHTQVVRLLISLVFGCAIDATDLTDFLDGAIYLFIKELHDYVPDFIEDNYAGIAGFARDYILKGDFDFVDENSEDVVDPLEGYLNWAGRRVRSVALLHFQIIPDQLPRLLPYADADPIVFTTESISYSLVGNGARCAFRDNQDLTVPYGTNGSKHNGCSFYFEFVYNYNSSINLRDSPEGLTNVYNTTGLGSTINFSGLFINNGTPVGCFPAIYHLQNKLRLVIYQHIVGQEHPNLAGSLARIGFHVIICDDIYVYFSRGVVFRQLIPTNSCFGLYVTLGVGNNKVSGSSSLDLQRMRPQLANVLITVASTSLNSFRFANPGSRTIAALSSEFEECGNNFSGWKHPWMQPGYAVPEGLSEDTWQCTDEAYEYFVANYNNLNKISFHTGDTLVYTPFNARYDTVYDLLQNAMIFEEINEDFKDLSLMQALIGSVSTGGNGLFNLRRTVMLKNYLLDYNEILALHNSLRTIPLATPVYSAIPLQQCDWADFTPYYQYKMVDLDFREMQNDQFKDSVDVPPALLRCKIKASDQTNSLGVAPKFTSFREKQLKNFVSNYKTASVEHYCRITDLPQEMVFEQEQLAVQDEVYISKPTIEIEVQFDN